MGRFGNGLCDVGKRDSECGVLVELDKDYYFFIDEIESGVYFDFLAGYAARVFF